MIVNKKLFNTLPDKKDDFWQVVIFPTISIVNSLYTYDKYVCVSFEWLFWSLTFTFSKT
jgi:hypothetical protein